MKRLAFFLLLLAAGAAEAQTAAPAPQAVVPSPPAAPSVGRSAAARPGSHVCLPRRHRFRRRLLQGRRPRDPHGSRPAGDRAVAPAGRLGLRLRQFLLRAARTGPRGDAHGGRSLDALPCRRPPRRAAAHLRRRRPHHHALPRRHLPPARAPRRWRAGSRPRPMVPGSRWRRAPGAARRHGGPTGLSRSQGRPADRGERQRAGAGAQARSDRGPLPARRPLSRHADAAACLPNA